MLHLGHQLHQEIILKDSQINSLKRRNDYFSSYMALEDRFNIASHPNVVAIYLKNNKEINGLIKFLLSWVVIERDAFFDFYKDIWSFRIYLYDEKSELLEPAISFEHDLHPSYQKEGRKWKPGDGHVGKAFLDGTAKITGDASVPAVMNFIRVKNEKPYDNRIYKSFASIPIACPNPSTGAEDVYGVVVATSDIKNRFDEENAAVLEMLADKIGVILCLTKKGGKQ